MSGRKTLPSFSRGFFQKAWLGLWLMSATSARASDLVGSNLIVNGGFELPDVSSGCWHVYTDQEFEATKWHVTAGPGFEIIDNEALAHGGTQFAELDGIYSSTIAQTVPTTPGTPYRLQFWYTPKPRNGFYASPEGDNRIDIKVDGVVKYIVGPGRAGETKVAWQQHFLEFVATSATTTVSFADAGLSNGHGGFLDDLEMYALNPSVLNDWRSHIKTGDPFYVVFDATPFDDTGWLGATKDPMGTFLGGQTYQNSYSPGGIYATTGVNEETGTTVTTTCTRDGITPDLARFSLGCRDYTFSSTGTVIDIDFGLVGRLRRCATEAQEQYLSSVPKAAITGTTNRVYVGGFSISNNAKEWKGQMSAHEVTVAGVNEIPLWTFREKLDGQAASNRRVYTELALAPIDLRTMNATQAFAVYQAMGISTAIGSTVMNFVLNPNLLASFVGLPLVLKTSRLSAIFHSKPVLVDAPSNDVKWAGSDSNDMTGYELFKSAHTARPERIFVGSNTGMLHAICENSKGISTPNCGAPRAGVGSEVFAFVPPSVLPKLNATRQGHAYTVDGSFGVADVCLESGCSTADKWKTLLMGSLHKGGKSLYTLDVTSPGASEFLWELTDAALGETWSAPTLTRARVSLDSGGTNRWVALVGGGYLNPSGNNSDVSNSVLVVNLHTGAILEDNTTPSNNPARFARYRVDMNPASCATAASTCILPRNSIPARLAVAREGKSAYANYAYFGDTQGRMWNMDMISSQVANWKPKLLFDASKAQCAVSTQGSSTPIFDVEVDSSLVDTQSVGSLPFPKVTDPRPIFQRVMAVTTGSGKATVFAGTGDVLDPNWQGGSETPESYDYFYAVRHQDVVGVCSGAPMWIKRFRKGEKMLSEPSLGNGIIFVPAYRRPQNATNLCGLKGDSRIYAFYQSSGRPAKVFDPDNNSNTNNSTHILEFNNTGYLSDLVFIPNSEDPSSGRIVFATDNGTPMSRAVTNGSPLTSGAIPRAWRRMY